MAQDRQLSQTHTIEIEVECLDYAIEVIRQLEGHNLESSVFSNDFGRWGIQRQANFTRRVDGWVLAHVQDVLRGMGDVTHEHQHAQFIGGMILDIDTRLATLEQEIQRLSIMLAASDSLDVMIAIEARLSDITWERNQVMGQRNVLLNQADSAVIYIMLVQPPYYRPAPAGPGFGSRVADSFLRSWRGIARGAANILVLIVRTFLPLLVMCVIVSPLAVIVYSVYKRRRAAIIVTEPNIDDDVIPESNEPMHEIVMGYIKEGDEI